MWIGDLELKPYWENGDQPEPGPEGIRVRDEVLWLVKGPVEKIHSIKQSLGSVARKLDSSLLLIDFGNSVGRRNIPFLGQVNVYTGKWGENDFNRMLEELTLISGGLPYSAGSATSLPFDRSLVSRKDVFYHAFVYLRYILLTDGPMENLIPSLDCILRDPHRRMAEYRRLVPLESAGKINPGGLTSIFAKSGNLVKANPAVQANIRLAALLSGFLPELIEEKHHLSTYDTAENRFVKTFLGMASGIIERMRTLEYQKNPMFRSWILEDCWSMEKKLRPILQHSIWDGVGEMIHFPASSTILQRRRGYKEVFRHFSKLKLTTRIPIPQMVLEQLLETKNIATLYELWCYFVVCRKLEEIIGKPIKAGEVTSSELEVSVKWDFKVEWADGTKVYYNLSFSRTSPKGRRAYSVQLRPDIVLETAHGDLHLLDAKFKLDKIDSVMNSEDYMDSDADEHRGVFKKDDLYKMHTYRDAIPRARSVWILYPGSEFRFFATVGEKVEEPSCLLENPEGVGAIPLKPSSNGEELGMVLGMLGRSIYPDPLNNNY